MTAGLGIGGQRGLTTELRREAATGYLFILPVFVGFLLFVLGPVIAAVALSLTRYDLITPPTFVGLSNYQRMFADPRLLTTYANTVIYVIAAVVLMNVLGLGLAVLLNRHLPFGLRSLLRSAYFFPSLVGLAYVSIIWQALFQPDVGVMNYYLTELGGPRIPWSSSTAWAIPSVVIVDVWKNVGFGMLIFLAALQDVPKEIVEAAQVDGASPWSVFRRVTIPMISPAIFFNVTLTIVGAFQIFESIVVLTGGGPADASRSVVMYIYEQAFQNFRIGYGSAIAVTLFVIIMVVTIIQFRLRRSWVYYE
ncbi:MAG: sugar ABC transporter permease [Chloroflexota bacterium]|nr:sugar ABC transporter permease [Chloroflexota bacterium]